MDPLLDDSVAFAHRLRSLNKWVHLQVVDNLPHGFLSFAIGSKEAQQGSELCMQCIAEVLHVQLKKSKQNSSIRRVTSTSVDGDTKPQSTAGRVMSPLVDVMDGSTSVDVLSPPAGPTDSTKSSLIDGLIETSNAGDQREGIVPEKQPSDGDALIDQSASDDQNP